MIAERVAALRQRVQHACERAGRDPKTVNILAVSKGHRPSAIREAWEAGLRRFGENYVQPWLLKADDPLLQTADGLQWHFVGHLQRNKIRFLLGRTECIETIDSTRLAEALSRRAQERGAAQRVLIQVNLAGEQSKGGITGPDLLDSLDRFTILPGLRVEGLMAIPPRRDSLEAARQDHRSLFQLRRELQQRWGSSLPELSMGMSADFEVAIEEGSTQVRVGTALFGPRPPQGG